METMIRYVNASGKDCEQYFDLDDPDSLRAIDIMIGLLVRASLPFKMITAKKK